MDIPSGPGLCPMRVRNYGVARPASTSTPLLTHTAAEHAALGYLAEIERRVSRAPKLP